MASLSPRLGSSAKSCRRWTSLNFRQCASRSDQAGRIRNGCTRDDCPSADSGCAELRRRPLHLSTRLAHSCALKIDTGDQIVPGTEQRTTPLRSGGGPRGRRRRHGFRESGQTASQSPPSGVSTSPTSSWSSKAFESALWHGMIVKGAASALTEEGVWGARSLVPVLAQRSRWARAPALRTRCNRAEARNS